jgi:hypothetical protein
MAIWALFVFLAGLAPQSPAAVDSLLDNPGTPFAPQGFHINPPPQRVQMTPNIPVNYEFHGYTRIGDTYEISLYETRTKTSFWISQGDSSNPLVQVTHFDPGNPTTPATVEVQSSGRTMQLNMVEPSTQAMAVPPPTPPLVVYSPFDTGGGGRGGRGNQNGGGGVPAPTGAGAPGANALLRGAGANGGRGGAGGAGGNNTAGNGRGGRGGNGAGGAGGGAGGGFGGGGAGGGGGGFGGGGAGGGFGGGGAGAGAGAGVGQRRTIQQPGG